MQFKHLTPMLYTRDLKSTAAFYKDFLGFELDSFSEDPGWVHMHKDNASIMFCLPNEHEPFEKAAFTGSFYFYTDEVDELWEKLKTSANVCYGLENFDYGMREFAIKDNNGYLLQFGKEIDAE